MKAVPDPPRRQLFLDRILREPRGKPRKIDDVNRLILVETGEDVADGARVRVAMWLQALRADLLS